MPSPLPSSAQPIHWILDWDGTLTTRDTLDALVNIAAEHKPNVPILEEWSRLSEAYLADFEGALGNHLTDGKLPYSVSEEQYLLLDLGEVEQTSVDCVSESGIFKGLKAAHLDDGAAKAMGAGRVEIRKGCNDFMRHVRARMEDTSAEEKDSMNILSVNWSQRFIAACLRESRIECPPSLLNSIYANELEGINSGELSTGRICSGQGGRIISSHDKLLCFETLRRTRLDTEGYAPAVYVGDSWTDLECLLAADLGICMRDEPMTGTQKKLAESLTRLGIRCPHLSSARDVDGWRIVWARDFQDIQVWIGKMS